MTRCIRPRGGPLWPLALPMIPYMRANLARKRSGLAAADAIVAVSTTIAADLRARAPEIAATRLEIIPNPVDVAGLRASAAAAAPPVAGPYALYLGKLAPNKGTSHLVDVAGRARLEWPLVIVGDGPERDAIEAQAKRQGATCVSPGWADRPQTVAWLAHASLLIFPSRGPESLSRVLLEASALGVPIAAMKTGGTPDIVRHGETGLLSSTPEALADDVAGCRERAIAAAARHRRERLHRAHLRHSSRRPSDRSVVSRPAEIRESGVPLIKSFSGRLRCPRASHRRARRARRAESTDSSRRPRRTPR